MPKYKVKSTEEVDAVQFSGNNWVTMQKHAGSHNLDPAGNYTVPNFDNADTWWPERPDDAVTAVVYIDGEWAGVKQNDWIVKSTTGQLSVMTDEKFTEQYDSA